MIEKTPENENDADAAAAAAALLCSVCVRSRHGADAPERENDLSQHVTLSSESALSYQLQREHCNLARALLARGPICLTGQDDGRQAGGKMITLS